MNSTNALKGENPIKCHVTHLKHMSSMRVLVSFTHTDLWIASRGPFHRLDVHCFFVVRVPLW